MSCKAIDLAGQRFGRLVALRKTYAPEGSRQHTSWWLCKCDCGAQKVVGGNSLRRGATRSCGCLRMETNLHKAQLMTKVRMERYEAAKASAPPKPPKAQRSFRIVPREKAMSAKTRLVVPHMPIVRCCTCGKKFELLSPEWVFKGKKGREGRMRYGCSWKCWRKRDEKWPSTRTGGR